MNGGINHVRADFHAPRHQLPDDAPSEVGGLGEDLGVFLTLAILGAEGLPGAAVGIHLVIEALLRGEQQGLADVLEGGGEVSAGRLQAPEDLADRPVVDIDVYLESGHG